MYIKKIIVFIAILGMIGGGIFAYFVYSSVFDPNTSFETETVTITIPTGTTYAEVRTLLEPYLSDMESFDAIAKRKGYTKRVKAGRYILKKGSGNNTIIDNLRSRNTPIAVTFNNQERLEDLAGRIAAQIEADSSALIQSFKDQDFIKANNFTTATSLGMYIPNKYEFFWNTSAEEFRDRMLQEYKRFWNEERLKKAADLNLTPDQVMTIASIVQKETAKVDERPRVAGVYLNRYKNGWKLDADPTIIYAMKRYRNDWKTPIKRVLYRDLELESPYNTYRNKELPPGLITMPDISAIEAVLNPEDHSYFFFVANTGKPGYHLFSKTLSEHNRRRQQYVKWINKQGILR